MCLSVSEDQTSFWLTDLFGSVDEDISSHSKCVLIVGIQVTVLFASVDEDIGYHSKCVLIVGIQVAVSFVLQCC